MKYSITLVIVIVCFLLGYFVGYAEKTLNMESKAVESVPAIGIHNAYGNVGDKFMFQDTQYVIDRVTYGVTSKYEKGETNSYSTLDISLEGIKPIANK